MSANSGAQVSSTPIATGRLWNADMTVYRNGAGKRQRRGRVCHDRGGDSYEDGAEKKGLYYLMVLDIRKAKRGPSEIYMGGRTKE
jgi:hypothetical protein